MFFSHLFIDMYMDLLLFPTQTIPHPNYYLSYAISPLFYWDPRVGQERGGLLHVTPFSHLILP